MSYDTARPHIASYVWLERDGKVAFLLRTATQWMNGHYGLPAGKVEVGESYSHAAIREAKEEAGVTIAPADLQPIFTVQRFYSNKETNGNPEWVDLFFKATKWEGEPFNAEPHKHGELVWLDPKNLPKNMVPYIQLAVEKVQAGEIYAEHGWES